MWKLYLLLSVYFFLSCHFNSNQHTLNDYEIWKLKWRMVISDITKDYSQGLKQFDSLLLFDKNIEDKFLVAGLELLQKNNDTLRIKQILKKVSKKTLQNLCEEELFLYELPTFIDCKSFSEKIENPKLQFELVKMFVHDQYDRGANVDFYLKKYNISMDSILNEDDNIKNNDENNTKNLIKIIDRFGFPTKEMVGIDGMDATFFIIQHSNNLEFQSNQLQNVKNAVENGELELSHYAFLYDRVAVRNGKKQKYGTQLDGKLKLKPVENMNILDSLRMTMGLMPINMYVSFLNGKYNKK